ncbi:HEAT repeat domain-containing protein [Alkalicoccus urumqiensis]|uniref:HEAT repeat domain-containing protein n=1 Tax=Alkalicoccus urumqiensis TaxID=1548213 RepID=UPI0015E5DFF2|nr:hypothetical protein [Alkalicoccus urumqiensis]
MGILVVLQAVMLCYLILSKSRQIRYEKRKEESFQKLLPAVLTFSESEGDAPELPKEKKLRREIVEELLDRITAVTLESEARNRLLGYAGTELAPAYEQILNKGTWAERMNALYYIEDFRLEQAADMAAVHIKEHEPKEEEYRQTARVLAVLDHPEAARLLVEDTPSSERFIKEMLRRLPAERLLELVEQLDETPEHDRLRQALYVYAGEQGILSLLPYVEAALIRENKETRLRAMRALCYFGHMQDPDRAASFFQSVHWEERMYACKLTRALSRESWRQEVMERLGDESWWVRSAAAEALRSFSDGEILLEFARSSHPDRYGRDMADAWLSMEVEV